MRLDFVGGQEVSMLLQLELACETCNLVKKQNAGAMLLLPDQNILLASHTEHCTGYQLQPLL